MFVTQTFLGVTFSPAKFYIYFLYEDYKDPALHEYIARNVEEFGLKTDSNVAVVIPKSGYGDATMQEVASQMQEFYQRNISGATPGLLLTKRPLYHQEALSDAIYFSLSGIKEATTEAKNIIVGVQEKGILEKISRINEYLIIKPTVLGVGVDINKVIDDAIAELKAKRKH